MRADAHAFYRSRIADLLVTGAREADERGLRDHLEGCADCRDYLESNLRVVAALGNFAFETAASSEEQVSRRVQLRLDELAATASQRQRLAWTCAAGVLLAVGGVAFDVRVADAIASIFHLTAFKPQSPLVLLWIVASASPVLLFPMLPLLGTRARRTA